ncbi:MAG: adenylosuccinate lyase [Crocinitomicaceae bacterium TMED114]|nr:MAG: adenylosuccinate lyase [Crocinitomicaceae bacterium TMED114]
MSDSATLNAISPIDGRYRRHTAPLAAYFSEAGLIQYRVRVEIEYLIALHGVGLPQLPALTEAQVDGLRAIYVAFGESDAQAVKDIERTTNHDVKAVEYFIKDKLPALGLEDRSEFVHFGLTSQDVNNTAIPLSMMEATTDVLLPLLQATREDLNALAEAWKSVPMLARTHGQPASPVTLGKELSVFVERLDHAIAQFEAVPFAAKFGGATGGFNAHHVAYPDTDWHAFADQFVSEELGLHRSHPTTQIEHYDYLAAWCHALERIHTILIDLDRDVWHYISLDYFKQRVVEGEVGSSAMPHKVNPIDFENSEGNLGVANALLAHLAAKLPISRLQRDLTDSTVLRNVGVPVGHSVIALKSLRKGLGKLVLNEARISADLEAQWAVVAEAIQTVLRREGVEKPYELLKALTRGKAGIDAPAISEFIQGLPVSDAVKSELAAITPHNYIGTTGA